AVEEVSTGELGSGPGAAEQLERSLVLLPCLGRGGQQGSGAGGQTEGEGSSGGNGAVVQPVEGAFSQFPLTGAGGGLHQVGQRLGADQRRIVGVRRDQALHGGAVVAEADL